MSEISFPSLCRGVRTGARLLHDREPLCYPHSLVPFVSAYLLAPRRQARSDSILARASCARRRVGRQESHIPGGIWTQASDLAYQKSKNRTAIKGSKLSKMSRKGKFTLLRERHGAALHQRTWQRAT